MINTINEYQFKDAFMSVRPDNFSYEGLSVLFDYFEELENDIGEQIELDVIAICCDYSEARYSEIYTDYIACKHNGKLNIYNEEIYTISNCNSEPPSHSFSTLKIYGKESICVCTYRIVSFVVHSSSIGFRYYSR